MLGQGAEAPGWADMWSWAMGRVRGGLSGGGWAVSPGPGSSAPSFCPLSPYFSSSHPLLASHPALIPSQSCPCGEASGVGRADMKGRSGKHRVKSASLCLKIQPSCPGHTWSQGQHGVGSLQLTGDELIPAPSILCEVSHVKYSSVFPMYL